MLSGNNRPSVTCQYFFQNRSMDQNFLWKGVKCFCSDVQKPSATLPDDFGHPRPIFNFFVISKKALFRWYTFGLRISYLRVVNFAILDMFFIYNGKFILDILNGRQAGPPKGPPSSKFLKSQNRFLQAASNVNVIICKLQKLNKHELNLLQA